METYPELLRPQPAEGHWATTHAAVQACADHAHQSSDCLGETCAASDAVPLPVDGFGWPLRSVSGKPARPNRSHRSGKPH